MIELIHESPYLSLIKKEDYILKDFSIITGINGSGKTHLLNAIDQGNIMVRGINPSSITYYNYNHFNIAYEGTLENEGLRSKEEQFMSKSSEFYQKLQDERLNVLNSYKVWNNSLLVPEHIFIIGLNIDSLHWTDEEFESLKSYGKSNNHLHLNQQKNILGEYLLQKKNSNFKNLISELKDALIKHHILISMRNINSEFLLNLNWNDSEVDIYNLQKQKEDNFKFQPTIPGSYSTMGFSLNFVYFVIAIESNFFLSQIEKQYGLIKLKNYLLELSEDIKSYFKETVSKEYLDLAIKINGEENVFEIIQVGHGFLNLQEIANEEKSYQLSKLQNSYNQFLSTQQEAIQYYTEEEFLKLHGLSPIDLLNEVLNEYDCNGYEFKKSYINVDIYKGSTNQNVSITLYNKVHDYVTNLEALSSGEKTLIALSFYLYKLQQNKAITRLLLLDEIDSALHPLMCKRLLHVLYNIFHLKMGIKIIISSHSSSTVALAPDECIFLMDKYSTPKISKVSKDKALKELTVGVPSFSINHENRRQVFVESENDVDFYEGLYNIYNSNLNSEISLNFISSGDSRTDKNGIPVSNCDQVIKITKVLRIYGNKSVWGIIDWDLKDTVPSEEYVKVLGFKERYSIENYLLDPLLLSILLWHERILGSEKFEFNEDKRYPEVSIFDESHFQLMIDKVVSDIDKNRKDNNNSELIEYQLLNKFSLKIPKWYCEIQGHELEDLIIETYPELKKIRKKEPDLKKAIIHLVIEDFPNLVPVELFNILESLQKE
ncbi:AAA family ATPase [Chryseobacterium sp. L7]|uniref:AAA family ATPase n=1 Tax=Chryseobacterium endalhagicum TaxID=2797638 RepID=A0ABS1QD29_9FLAO|nr:AAA family ATPase [Chryseobacterium endalhagicum]MBL1220202.1 AAA family ATPase [Chryseobacterium endalhagicum]